jgi:hypothetical protein
MPKSAGSKTFPLSEIQHGAVDLRALGSMSWFWKVLEGRRLIGDGDAGLIEQAGRALAVLRSRGQLIEISRR